MREKQDDIILAKYIDDFWDNQKSRLFEERWDERKSRLFEDDPEFGNKRVKRAKNNEDEEIIFRMQHIDSKALNPVVVLHHAAEPRKVMGFNVIV